MVKNLLANAEVARDLGSIPGLRRSPGRWHGNPLQYSCLENPMNRGAWQATAYRVSKSQTRPKQLSTRSTHVVFPAALNFFRTIILNSFSGSS